MAGASAGAPRPDVDDASLPIAIEIRRGSGFGDSIIAVSGEIDVATSPELSQAIHGALEQATSITIDLSATTFIDSSGLGVLVSALKRARELGHESVTLRGVQEPVRRVLEITGLTELFAVED
jgi:anti-sigma B factor antagonist